MNEIDIPVSVTGPGSQPAENDGASLDILQLPDEMTTFSMPEMPEPDQVQDLDSGMAALTELDEVLQHQAKVRDIKPEVVDITHLDRENSSLVDQVLGEGEVSMVYRSADSSARIQESVMAGIWRIRYYNQQEETTVDTIEVARVPRLCRRHVFSQAAHRADSQLKSIPEGVLNAPPLLAEINDKVSEYRPGKESHVINLTLLPQTEQDLAFLIERLGEGSLTILSRGYGNCRITSTAVQNVWWVQYFNSQDKNILNTLEIGDVPAVAAAANEDIQESARRLNEIMEAYR
ncbi:MAG: hydrogenase expression/formation C-terminal domain-containing protein [Candidatus Thiodiazotropha endolucinida]